MRAECVVSADVKSLLLAWYHCRSLGLLSEKFPGPAKGQVANITLEDSLEAVKADFSDVLSDSIAVAKGKMNRRPPMKIQLREDIDYTPLRVHVARNVPRHLQADAEKLTKETLESRLIEPVDEPTDWCAPSFFVQKPSGRGVRLVTDFRALNKVLDVPRSPSSQPPSSSSA